MRSSRRTPLLLAWRTSSPMPYEISSAASDVSLARFGLRIIQEVRASAARCKTAECVAKGSRPVETIALRECDSRAGDAVRRRRIAEFGTDEHATGLPG